MSIILYNQYQSKFKIDNISKSSYCQKKMSSKNRKNVLKQINKNKQSFQKE